LTDVQALFDLLVGAMWLTFRWDLWWLGADDDGADRQWRGLTMERIAVAATQHDNLRMEAGMDGVGVGVGYTVMIICLSGTIGMPMAPVVVN